ncbi:MAG: VCBS repeat-containing protein, partial [Myxococcota bacterium]
MNRITTRSLAALVAALVGHGCADLTALPPNACGNSVVEADVGEDCDTIVDSALGDGLLCGPADGSAQACRYVCDGAECPAGWTCEDDGICRAPSGTFESDDEAVLTLRVDELLMANLVDDDGEELIARADGDVSIFSLDDEGFRRDSELSILNPRGRLAAVDIDLDGALDLIAPSAGRFADESADAQLHALRHGPERLQTVVVPQRNVATLGAPNIERINLATAVRPTPDSAAEVPFVVAASGDVIAAFVPEPSCDALPPTAVATLGAGMGRTVLPPAARPADASGGALVAVPLEGGTAVVVTVVLRQCGEGLCGVGSGASTECVSQVLLSTTVDFDEAVATPGCAFWDIDGNGDDDLVCHVEGGRVRSAAWTGVEFEPAVDRTEELAGRTELPAGQPRACDPGHAILTTGDLDGDGRVDIVTPHGVFLAAPGGFRLAFARVRGEAWQEAVIGDFNGDGTHEVVASVREGNDCAPTQLEHLVQTLGSFSSGLVPNAPPPRQLRNGDVDGDGLSDVVITGVTSEFDARIITFFGDAKESLEDRVEVGDFANVQALVPLRSREGTDLNEDLIADLAIVSAGGRQWTMVTGTPDRSLLSPLPLERDAGPAVGVAPIVALGGHLLAGPVGDDGELGPPDLLALAPGHVWLYRDEGVHHGDDVLHLTGDAIPPPLGGFRVECSRFDVLQRGAAGAVLAGVDGVQHPAEGCDPLVRPSVVVGTMAEGPAGP